jgi:hypothetical protein
MWSADVKRAPKHSPPSHSAGTASPPSKTHVLPDASPDFLHGASPHKAGLILLEIHPKARIVILTMAHHSGRRASKPPYNPMRRYAWPRRIRWARSSWSSARSRPRSKRASYRIQRSGVISTKPWMISRRCRQINMAILSTRKSSRAPTGLKWPRNPINKSLS